MQAFLHHEQPFARKPFEQRSRQPQRVGRRPRCRGSGRRQISKVRSQVASSSGGEHAPDALRVLVGIQSTRREMGGQQLGRGLPFPVADAQPVRSRRLGHAGTLGRVDAAGWSRG
jgi:hypothetical protein